MLLVPDITAGTGTEFEETLVRGGSVGRSQSEGAQERVLSVDGSLFRVPGHLGVGRPSIYTTALLGKNHPGHVFRTIRPTRSGLVFTPREKVPHRGDKPAGFGNRNSPSRSNIRLQSVVLPPRGWARITRPLRSPGRQGVRFLQEESIANCESHNGERPPPPSVVVSDWRPHCMKPLVPPFFNTLLISSR